MVAAVKQIPLKSFSNVSLFVSRCCVSAELCTLGLDLHVRVFHNPFGTDGFHVSNGAVDVAVAVGRRDINLAPSRLQISLNMFHFD